MDKRQILTLCRVTTACALTVAGVAASGGALIPATSPIWVKSLIEILGGGIGGNLVANLVEHLFHHTQERLTVERDKMNHDISKALATSFKEAAGDTFVYWKQERVELVRILGGNEEQANTVLIQLEAIKRDADELVNETTLVTDVFTDETLVQLLHRHQREHADAVLTDYLTEILQKYLGVQDVAPIQETLLEFWVERFRELLKQTSEDATKARHAFEQIWRETIDTTLIQVRLDTTEIKQVVNALIEQHQRHAWAQEGLHLTTSIQVEENRGILEKIRCQIDEQYRLLQRLVTTQTQQAGDFERATIRSRLLHWLSGFSSLTADERQRLTECLLTCQAITHIVPLDWSTYFRNRIDKLVAMVQCNETDLTRVQELDDILDSMKSLQLVVKRSHLRSLETILLQILPVSHAPVETVRGWYYTSLPQRGGYATLPDYHVPYDENVSSSSILSIVLSKLADIKKNSDGSPFPLAKFVHRLLEDVANDIQPEQQQEIHTWLQQAGFPVPATPDSHPTPPEASTSVNAYLMILFQPDQYHPEQHIYEVKAWFLADDQATNSHQQLDTPEKSITLCPDSMEQDDPLPDLLENLWKQCKPLLASGQHQTMLTIEFFLPHMLLLHHVERTKVKVKSRPRPIGLEYRVVVRAQERHDPQTRGDYYADWLRRWHNYTVCQLPSNMAITVTSDDDCTNDERLYARLLQEKDACAIVHTSVPSKCHRQQQLETLFFSALDAGFPIMLLPRYPDDQPDLVRQQIYALALAQSCPLEDLPQVVQQKRVWAVEKEQLDHPHNHLTLVWDDPTRLPPDDIFTFEESPT